MSESIYAVFGASGLGSCVMPAAREQLRRQGAGDAPLVFVDDRPRVRELNGHPVMSYAEFLATDTDARFVVVAINDSAVRERIALRCSADAVQAWSVVADNAVVLDAAQIGEGAVLRHFATVASNVTIGCHFQAGMYAYVSHDCALGDYVTLAPGAKCNGNVRIEDHAYIGSGAVIRQGHPDRPLVIGRGAVIGIGAVVTHDVPPDMTVVGNPAKPMIKD